MRTTGLENLFAGGEKV